MPETRLQIGVMAAALSDDAREAVRLSREGGFGGLLFDAVSSTLDLTALSGTGRREFARVLSSQAQSLIGLRADLGPKGFEPGADVERLLARLDAICRATADLGAQVFCLDLGPLPAPAPTVAPKPKIAPQDAGLIIVPEPAPTSATTTVAPPADPAVVAQVDTALIALGEIAERYHTTVALSSSLSSYAALDRAITVARCPWFGVDLDPVAMLRDAWKTDEIFSRIGQLIRLVRARDAVRGEGSRTKPTIVGRGSVKWRELLDALEALGYRGWITVDPMELTDRAGAARAGLVQLRALLL